MKLSTETFWGPVRPTLVCMHCLKSINLHTNKYPLAKRASETSYPDMFCMQVDLECPRCGHEMVALDGLITNVVIKLNQFYYVTKACCAGHMICGDPNNPPYAILPSIVFIESFEELGITTLPKPVPKLGPWTMTADGCGISAPSPPEIAYGNPLLFDEYQRQCKESARIWVNSITKGNPLGERFARQSHAMHYDAWLARHPKKTRRGKVDNE